jgi:hypothetical protein
MATDPFPGVPDPIRTGYYDVTPNTDSNNNTLIRHFGGVNATQPTLLLRDGMRAELTLDNPGGGYGTVNAAPREHYADGGAELITLSSANFTATRVVKMVARSCAGAVSTQLALTSTGVLSPRAPEPLDYTLVIVLVRSSHVNCQDKQ